LNGEKRLSLIVPQQVRVCPDEGHLFCPNGYSQCEQLAKVGLPILCEAISERDALLEMDADAERHEQFFSPIVDMYYLGVAMKLAHNTIYGMSYPDVPNLTRYEYLLNALPLVQNKGLVAHTTAWILGQILCGISEHSIWKDIDVIKMFPPEIVSLGRQFAAASENPVSNARKIKQAKDARFLQIMLAEWGARLAAIQSSRARVVRETKEDRIKRIEKWVANYQKKLATAR
jgi:hypothetical protein